MNDVHDKAKQGIKLLMGRQVALQVLTFGGGIVLARVLGPAQFGLYAIASFLVAIFAQFGDFGLAPSLIQRKEELTDYDLSVAFTLQQIVTSIIVLVLLVLAPWLAHFYPKAPSETVWLVRALALNLYFTSWRTMSALQLERHLKYGRLARIEVIESLSYQGTAVVLAVTRHGVWSYVIAVLASGFLGSVLVYTASPWKIRFAYNRQIAYGILKFGLPFQLQSIVNQIGGWVTPILVGSLIGPQAVGYLTWASSNGKKPLVLVDNVMRVAFPHFSRIQGDPVEVHKTIVKYLNWLLIPAGLWLAVMAVSGPSLVKVIYTAKWLPAVPALILFSGALSLDVVSWVICVSLNSMGKVTFVTRMVFIRSIASVCLSVAFVFTFGFVGIPIGYVVAGVLIVPWMIRGLGPGKVREILRSLSWIVLPIGVSIILGTLDVRIGLPTLAKAATSLIVVVVSYTTCIWLFGPNTLKNSFRAKLRSKRVALNVVVADVIKQTG